MNQSNAGLFVSVASRCQLDRVYPSSYFCIGGLLPDMLLLLQMEHADGEQQYYISSRKRYIPHPHSSDDDSPHPDDGLLRWLG